MITTMETDPKLTVMLPLRVSVPMAKKLTKRAGSERKRPEWIRQRIAAALKPSRKVPLVTAAEARAVIEARRSGLDVVLELQNSLARAQGLPAVAGAFSEAQAIAPQHHRIDRY
jgi:hypothetical protein